MIWQSETGKVAVYDGGEAHQEGAPVICFVHGAAMDHTVWTLFARYWAKRGFNVVAIDLPGHGGSEGKPFATIVDSSKFLVELIDNNLPSADVFWVGHSMGSLIALECAHLHERSKALVMMGTAFPMAVGDALLNSAKANEHLAIDIISLFGHRDQMTPARAASGLIECIPGAQVFNLPCGHMMMTEKPEQTHQCLLKCIETSAA